MRRNLFFSSFFSVYVKVFLLGVLIISMALWGFFMWMSFLITPISLQTEIEDKNKHVMCLIIEPIAVSLSLGIDLQKTRGVTSHFEEIVKKYPNIQSITLLNHEKMILKRYLSPHYLMQGGGEIYRETLYMNDHTQQYPTGFLEFSYHPYKSINTLNKAPVFMMGIFLLCLFLICLGQKLWKEDIPLCFALHYSLQLLRRGRFSTLFFTRQKNSQSFLIRRLNSFVLTAHDIKKNLDNHVRKNLFLRSGKTVSFSHSTCSHQPFVPDYTIDDAMLQVILEQYRIPRVLKRIFIESPKDAAQSLFYGMIMLEGFFSVFLLSTMGFQHHAFVKSPWLFLGGIHIIGLLIFWSVSQKVARFFLSQLSSSQNPLSFLRLMINCLAYCSCMGFCFLEKKPLFLGGLICAKWLIIMSLGRQGLACYEKTIYGRLVLSTHQKIFCISALCFFLTGLLGDKVLKMIGNTDYSFILILFLGYFGQIFLRDYKSDSWNLGQDKMDSMP